MAVVQTWPELLDLYARGERDFAESELDNEPYGDLQGLVLDDADLSRSFIVASFRGASLRQARFVDSNVKTCDFRDADLSGADFSGAALCSTQFTGAIMTGTVFTGASIHSHVLGEGETPNL